MNWRNSYQTGTDRLSIALHWLMFLLIVAVYACIELREIFPKGSDPREAMKTWHFMLGLSVFVLVWLRLGLRLLQPTPTIEPRPVTWQQNLANVLHWAFYALMIGNAHRRVDDTERRGRDYPFLRPGAARADRKK